MSGHLPPLRKHKKTACPTHTRSSKIPLNGNLLTLSLEASYHVVQQLSRSASIRLCPQVFHWLTMPLPLATNNTNTFSISSIKLVGRLHNVLTPLLSTCCVSCMYTYIYLFRNSSLPRFRSPQGDSHTWNAQFERSSESTFLCLL